MNNPLCLDTALDVGAEYLERASPWADRYSIPGEESTYFCRDCGMEIDDDPNDGCPHCGFGHTYFCRDCDMEIDDDPNDGCPHCGSGQPLDEED